jgi:hypothetical protein
LKIGASASLLIATMNFEDDIPARCWIAPLMPHTCASDSSTFPPPVAWTAVTRARDAASTLRFSTVATRPASGAASGKTFGRSVTSCGSPSQRTVANALPEYTARRASRRPSAADSALTSETSPAPVRAATRGARSLPMAVQGTRTASGLTAAITSASARA